MVTDRHVFCVQDFCFALPEMGHMYTFYNLRVNDPKYRGRAAAALASTAAFELEVIILISVCVCVCVCV